MAVLAATLASGAEKFVDNGVVGGDGSGSSWANAATAIPATSTLSAGDIVWVRSSTLTAYSAYTVSKSGSAATNAGRIWFIGVKVDGAKPVIRQFNGAGYDYIGLRGFEITQITNTGTGINMGSAALGWHLSENYVHDVYGGGVSMTGNSNDNEVHFNTIERVGMVAGVGLPGAIGVNVIGSRNSIAYNAIGLVGDYTRFFGEENVYRNNRLTYSNESEFPDSDITGGADLLITGGSWNASTGVWSKAGASITGIDVFFTASVYPDGAAQADRYGFYSNTTAYSDSTDSVTINISRNFGSGSIPSTGSGYTLYVQYPPHIDGMQSYTSSPALTKFVMENNFLTDNESRNSHWFIDQDDGPDTGHEQFVERGNLVADLGEGTHIWRSLSKFRSYSNTYWNPGKALTTIYNAMAGWEASQGGAPASDDFKVFNNGWFESGQNSSEDTVTGTGNVTNEYIDYNAVNGGGDLPGSNNITTSPAFTDTSTGVRNFMPQSGSPLRAAARYTALAVGDGSSSTSLTVDDSLCFVSGWAGWRGDEITVGGVSARISSINYGTNVITLASAISWSDGAEVRWQGRVDRSAIPYRAGGYTLTASHTNAGNDYTVTVIDGTGASAADAVAFVQPFENELPLPRDYDAPYTYTSSGGSVRFIVGHKYAHATPWFESTYAGGPPATVSVRNRGRSAGAPSGLGSR